MPPHAGPPCLRRAPRPRARRGARVRRLSSHLTFRLGLHRIPRIDEKRPRANENDLAAGFVKRRFDRGRKRQTLSAKYRGRCRPDGVRERSGRARSPTVSARAIRSASRGFRVRPGSEEHRPRS
ncbi:hypothetical protein EZV77_09055 [Burkholderia thailandensis]|nr:hypothetical protein CWD92_19100 [Burkholderia thailandensis]PNE77729.1 hypothetical protein A8H37_05395 [Burkholderia thailandensis]TBW65406.1 hypothetical protein EZV77_09055 [Burkholderia thailandensis]